MVWNSTSWSHINLTVQIQLIGKFDDTRLRNVTDSKKFRKTIYKVKTCITVFLIEKLRDKKNFNEFFCKCCSTFRGYLCNKLISSFWPHLLFNWRTFSRRVASHYWHQWAKTQVWTNQNSRNNWYQIVTWTIWLGVNSYNANKVIICKTNFFGINYQKIIRVLWLLKLTSLIFV